MLKKNDQKINEILKEMMNSKKLKPKLQQEKVKSIWERIMGPSIVRYTSNIHLRQAKLYINIDSAPLKQELLYGKEKILKMMNEEMGEEIIEQVIIR